MIVGRFDSRGRSYVEGVIYIPRLAVGGRVVFRLDTGADVTCLHPGDARALHIPFGSLQNRVESRGVGGRSIYYLESSLLSFDSGGQREICPVNLLIAEPAGRNDGLPSLLGLDVINRWYMEYDPANNRLEFTVR